MQTSAVKMIQAAPTGHVFELVHCGEDGRLAALQEEDDQQRQSVVVEERAGATGITCRSHVGDKEKLGSENGRTPFHIT